MAQGFSRRHFFYGTLLAGAVPAAGFGSVPSLTRLGYKSPNEKLNIASIGAGGKAHSDLNGCASENIVALCDVDEKRAARKFKEYEKAPKYKDFRRMLDEQAKNIDAVIVTIPDFMHATAANWCMERGKHVYVQKPLTRTVWEARQLQEAANKYKVATQMGNQGYSNEGTRQVAEMIWAGEIGNVTEVHAWTDRPIWPQGLTEIPPPDAVPDTLAWDLWLGIADKRPYTSGGKNYPIHGAYFYQPFNWRGFYDFGCGALGDMACHILGAANLALMLDAPTSVECIEKEGNSDFMYPTKSVIRYDFPARGSMPAVKLFWHDGLKDTPKIAGVPDGEILGDLPDIP
ncbi:MAG TPA: Gfo/Idh/MocA family oxidoreductase, partial [Bryobacteraceae bacterium]|nr:Gfo/Idh/MocA family oxidoreductase [Bryobacteraceae bacterium]